MNRPRKLMAGLAIGAIATGVATIFEHLGWLDRLEAITWDARVRALAWPVDAARVPIRLILIDQASLDWAAKENKIGWPWPRELYAAMVDYCTKAGATSITFDIRFEDPSMWGEEDDQKFIAALKAAPHVCLPVLPDPGGGSAGVTSWPTGVPSAGTNGGSSPIEDVGGWWSVPTAKSMAFATPEITAAATILGHVHGMPDSDGVVRRVQPAVVFDSRVIMSLGLATAAAMNPKLHDDAAHWPPRPDMPLGRLRYLDHDIELDRNRALGGGGVILNFPATQPALSGHMFPAYSAASVLQSGALLAEGKPPTVDPTDLKDRNVFIAFSAPALYDLVPTPGNPLAPGVEVHATTLLNLLNDSFVREPKASAIWAFTSILASAAAFLMLISRRVWHMGALFPLAMAVPGAAGMLHYGDQVWWPIIAPELACLLSLLASLMLSYATEGRQKRFIKRAFQQYLSPTVIEDLVADPSQLELGGQRRELTIFFSDIEGFTSISERMDSAELSRLLNDCLSDLSAIILDEGGTIDKYIGDAIVAFWNAPLDQPDHAIRACRAALKCQQRLAERRDDFAARAGSPLNMRIGINTGAVAVGNMGSTQRFNYTVLGNAANLASRLEGANKAFGTNVMIAESTWKSATSQESSELDGREIGVIRVVGKNEPVRVFELLGGSDTSAKLNPTAYTHALGLFRAGRVREAANAFAAMPDDPLAQRYASKLTHLLAGEDPLWDGIWNLTEK